MLLTSKGVALCEVERKGCAIFCKMLMFSFLVLINNLNTSLNTKKVAQSLNNVPLPDGVDG